MTMPSTKPAHFAVHVDTVFVESESSREDNRFVYNYTITLNNLGEQSAQLIARHWTITESDDRVQEVQGEGVVGQKPVIEPGESYTYSSGVVLDTPLGTMEGSYQMRQLDGSIFKASVPLFALVPPYAIH